MNSVYLKFILILLFPLLGCSGLQEQRVASGKRGTTPGDADGKEAPPTQVAGVNLLNLDQASIRCLGHEKSPREYETKCFTTITDPASNTEIKANRLEDGLKMAWALPKAPLGRQLVASSCNPTSETSLSQTCSIELDSSAGETVLFEAQVFTNELNRTLQDDLVLPYSVRTYGMVPEIPVNFELSGAAENSQKLGRFPSTFDAGVISSLLKTTTFGACFLNGQMFFKAMGRNEVFKLSANRVELFAGPNALSSSQSNKSRFDLNLPKVLNISEGSNEPKIFDLTCSSSRLFTHLVGGQLISLNENGEFEILLKEQNGFFVAGQSAQSFPYRRTNIVAQDPDGTTYFEQRKSATTSDIYRLSRSKTVTRIYQGPSVIWLDYNPTNQSLFLQFEDNVIKEYEIREGTLAKSGKNLGAGSYPKFDIAKKQLSVFTSDGDKNLIQRDLLSGKSVTLEKRSQDGFYGPLSHQYTDFVVDGFAKVFVKFEPLASGRSDYLYQLAGNSQSVGPSEKSLINEGTQGDQGKNLGSPTTAPTVFFDMQAKALYQENMRVIDPSLKLLAPFDQIWWMQDLRTFLSRNKTGGVGPNELTVEGKWEPKPGRLIGGESLIAVAVHQTGKVLETRVSGQAIELILSQYDPTQKDYLKVFGNKKTRIFPAGQILLAVPYLGSKVLIYNSSQRLYITDMNQANGSFEAVLTKSSSESATLSEVIKQIDQLKVDTLGNIWLSYTDPQDNTPLFLLKVSSDRKFFEKVILHNPGQQKTSCTSGFQLDGVASSANMQNSLSASLSSICIGQIEDLQVVDSCSSTQDQKNLFLTFVHRLKLGSELQQVVKISRPCSGL